MRIYMKLNSIDNDMVEMYCALCKQRYFMSAAHLDCFDFTEIEKQFLEDGLEIERELSTIEGE